MSKYFRPWNIDQTLLLPPNVCFGVALGRRSASGSPFPINKIKTLDPCVRRLRGQSSISIHTGAADFLLKPINSDHLLSAIEKAIARHRILRVIRAKDNVFRARFLTLTPRQRQVFELVVRGKQNKQIAHQLGATERTIKAHRHDVMEKMEARSLAELVIAGERLGFLSAPAAPRSIPDEASTA